MEIKQIELTELIDLLKLPCNIDISSRISNFNFHELNNHYYFVIQINFQIVGIATTSINKKIAGSKEFIFLEQIGIDSNKTDYHFTYLLLNQIVSFCAQRSIHLRVGVDVQNSLMVLGQDIKEICDQNHVTVSLK